MILMTMNTCWKQVSTFVCLCFLPTGYKQAENTTSYIINNRRLPLDKILMRADFMSRRTSDFSVWNFSKCRSQHLSVNWSWCDCLCWLCCVLILTSPAAFRLCPSHKVVVVWSCEMIIGICVAGWCVQTRTGGAEEEMKGARESAVEPPDSQNAEKWDDTRPREDVTRDEQVRDNKGRREKWAREQRRNSWVRAELRKKERKRAMEEWEQHRGMCVRVCVRPSGGKIREAISDCPSMSQRLCPL